MPVMDVMVHSFLLKQNKTQRSTLVLFLNPTELLRWLIIRLGNYVGSEKSCCALFFKKEILTISLYHIRDKLVLLVLEGPVFEIILTLSDSSLNALI